jgi:hypothetical protein
MLTAFELRDRLGWPGVDEEANEQNGLVYLSVRPTRDDRESIYFCLDESRSFVQQFGFGEWHCHPDEVAEAVEMARSLIRGERCLVEERDAVGKYCGSGLYPADGLPDTLRKEVASLRRVFFDREPAAERIDLGRYFQGKHISILHEHKAETERAYREVGMAVPDW